TAVNCTTWYMVLQGDNCPNIWNAANLTESTFLAINPGIRCQAPYLQVGQKVCINSPLLASLLTASNTTSFSLYTVQSGDSLALISSRFITRCTTSSISPAAIAAANNILETSPLVANTQLIIPCDARVGILDCGCAQSLPVCGADYVTYPSYCDAVCNYGVPVQSGVCSGCSAACTGRTGLAPAAGYGCTWSACPYPSWKPVEEDCTILQGFMPGKCCAVEQTVCTAAAGSPVAVAAPPPFVEGAFFARFAPCAAGECSACFGDALSVELLGFAVCQLLFFFDNEFLHRIAPVGV
ncbi:unnamed protein product, partial [Closterium sp. Naga37s-1]